MSEENAIHERGYVYNFHYHLVWVTKYRQPVFKESDQAQEMIGILMAIAANNEITVESGEVMPDHVHLLISFKPKYAPATVVKVFKGISARMWFERHPESRQLVWGGHLWAPSYYMGTLGDMSRKTVENYIANQRKERGIGGRPSKRP